jgi:hypothetical protein
MHDHSDSQIKNAMKDDQFVSSRHRNAEPDTFDPSEPRLGRRESEPHSAEITYLYSVLKGNFPNDRIMWDLHHYFHKEKMEIDIQFDISYFKNMDIPYTLSSYHAEQFDNRVPIMAINILSASTWRSDLAEKVDLCRYLEIPLYIVFPPYHVANKIYKPPFVRAYVLQEDGKYDFYELREIMNKSSEELVFKAIIDVSEVVPFRLGLLKKEQKHQDEEPLYRLVLIDSEKDKILLTENQKIISEQKQKIKNQTQEIEAQKQKIETLEAENKKLKDILKKE